MDCYNAIRVGRLHCIQTLFLLVKFVTSETKESFVSKTNALLVYMQPDLSIETYNPGQNVLGRLRKLGTKTHFAKLTRILPLKKAWRCCYKGLFLLSPSPPSSVDCVELKLECITPTLHRGGRGEGRCLNLTSYCVSVPRVLTRVVDRENNILAAHMPVIERQNYHSPSLS